MGARQVVGVQCLLAILWFPLTCLDPAITLGHGVISQWVQHVNPGGIGFAAAPANSGPLWS